MVIQAMDSELQRELFPYNKNASGRCLPPMSRPPAVRGEGTGGGRPVGGGGAVRGTGVPRHTSPVHCFPAVTTNEAV